MANISYKTPQEQFIMKDINLNIASIEEIEEYRSKMIMREVHCLRQIEIYLHNDHLDNINEDYEDFEKTVKSHLNKIEDGAIGSSPFDKKILEDKNVKSIDGLELYDFVNEDNFRACLELYHYYLLCQYALQQSDEFRVKKFKKMLLNTPIGTQTLINELAHRIPDDLPEGHDDEKFFLEIHVYNSLFNQIYDGNEYNRESYELICEYIYQNGRKFTPIQLLINKIEKKYY